MYRIELIPKERLGIIMPYIKQLNENTDDAILEQRLQEIGTTNYQCAGVYDADKLIGISGIWVLVKFYNGKHIEPDNVIIHPDYRSKGVGELMMQWIHDYAKAEGCTVSELNCYVSNHKGVRFWIQQGYKILGYHMQKAL